MFPRITHLTDLFPAIQDNPQFRTAKQPNGVSIVCYMLQDANTFSGEYSGLRRECRGSAFFENGDIASRPLHKFFNVGELEETQPENIPWKDITRITDKRDGSMITFVLLPTGDIVGKTKKTFDSPEALAATNFLYSDIKKLEYVTRLLSEGLTPIFEWTSPKFPIVILYEADELTLLQIRNNLTGEYVSAKEFYALQAHCPFPIVKNQLGELCHQGNIQQALLENAKTVTGIEGWVIQDDTGNMWKIKTQWYINLHHTVVFIRWRDIAKMVIAEQSDDLKAQFKMTDRDISPIIKVENEISATITSLHIMCQKTIMGWESNTAKEFALAHKNHPYFSLLMMAFNKRKINWVEWYKKHKLDEWPLDVVTFNT